MNTLLEELAELDASGLPIGTLTLSRAWPRSDGHLHLEYRAGDGAVVAAQSFHGRVGRPDLLRLHRAARATRSSAGGGAAVAIPSRGVLLHHGGVDRRLPALAPMLAERGAALVTHRPERRAVVRLDSSPARAVRPLGTPAREPRFAKVVKIRRVLPLVQASETLAGVGAPQLLSAVPATGLTVWSCARGMSLHEWMPSPRLPWAARAAGGAVALLHRRPARMAVAVHTPEDELSVLDGWAARTRPYDPALATAVERAARPARSMLEAASGPVGLVHRDCHDKQLFVADDGTPAIIDLDTLSVGEPALDLANILVHFELREWQGRCADARTACEAFLDGYRPSPAVRRRIRAYAAVVRLRLACLYTFRPGGAPLAERLLASVAVPPAGVEDRLPA